jgi:sugar phosphate isomerase/epimerase
VKLGLGTYAYAWAIGVAGYPAPEKPMDALAFVQQAASLGLNLVQIADNIPLHTLPNLAALLDDTRRLQMEVEVGTRGIGHDHLRQYIEIARQFRSPIVRVVVDTKEHHPTPEEVVETLRAIMPEFERANIVLAIENHDRFKAHTLVKIVQDIGSRNVGICLDTVNSFGALEGPDAVVSVLGPYVINLHLKEFRVRRADHHMGFAIEGCPSGQGMLDVPWLLDSLRHFGRHFNAIIELWPAPEATMEATIRKEHEWVAASVAYLKGLIPL